MPVSVQSSVFGTTSDGKEVALITLSHENGTTVELISYGAAFKKLIVKNGKGEPTDIMLGYDTLAEYENGNFYFGTTVGRVANRIGGGKFKLDGKDYNLPINRPPNHLHGGQSGFNRKIWKVDLQKEGVKFSYVSPDGEESYPGELHVSITYTLNSQGDLLVDYEANTDKPTIVNLTNHTFFNLEGEGTESIKDHVFHFFTDKFLLGDATNLVTGEVGDVHGTRWDFSKPKRIGDICESNFAFDSHMCFDLKAYTGREIKKIARIQSAKSGIRMEIASTQTGAQFYTGDKLSATGKNGKTYSACCGFALEPQACPDAINKPNFPSTVLRPGEKYHHTNRYSFSRL